ncbi:MAG: SpoIID/LytB domain-containing protein, partial [Clostridiales bacterium]|nr:SpoIID/LytB domain-containing protein [Clostridiales bacterium]
ISTDIKEAQAYDSAQVNDRIEKAVNETRGQVLSYNGELPYSWFHAHAGGITELPREALSYDKDNPGYTKVVQSPDSDKAPTNVKNWTATFTAAEVAQAAKQSGADVGTLSSISLGKKGESGRAVQLLINGKEVSAPEFRVAIGSKELKSTLISDVKLENGKVTFTGKGYGHGVGMSQWGAYGMAEEGKTYDQIIAHYFADVGVATLWE